MATNQGQSAVLILASTSPARRMLLSRLGLEVRCEAPGVDESADVPAHPRARALLLATRKAAAVAARFPDSTVLGADQVAWDGIAAFGKPSDPDDHYRRLVSLRGRDHWLFTGFAIVAPDGATHTGCDTTRLRMRGDLTDDELRAYVASGEGSGCAGGYAVEGQGGWLFEDIDGDYDNVLGLPVRRALSVLRELGFRLGASA